jgi:hypothetical protein
MTDIDASEVADIVIQNEKDQIAALPDPDLIALLDETRRAVFDTASETWLTQVLRGRADLCQKELARRERIASRGGPSVNTRGWQDRITAVKMDKSIAEVVALSGVALRKSGQSYIGLCPFHVEKTPSFHVYQDEGRFHCYGCMTRGDVIDYVREWKGIDMKLAVEFLEGRGG